MVMMCEKTCVPCQGGVAPLRPEESGALAAELDGWSVVNNHHIEREYTFSDFKAALRFVNAVGEIAEEQAHHPNIQLSWGKARISIWTHTIDGLTESDFILAAKIERLVRS